MAIYSSMLYGELHNSIHNLVMYTSRGQFLVRGKPLTIRNPRTAKQVASRAFFTAASQLAASLSPVEEIGFPSPYKTESRNALQSANKKIFSIDEAGNLLTDFSLLSCSGGKQCVPDVTAEWRDDRRALCIESHPQNISATASQQDKLYVMLLDVPTMQWKLHEFGERGTIQRKELELKPEWNADHICAYAFAVSANGKHASPTLYLL